MKKKVVVALGHRALGTTLPEQKVAVKKTAVSIADLVEEGYCPDNGRPSIDPVVLIKIAVIQYMFGIKSMRQTIKEIEVNIAYR